MQQLNRFIFPFCMGHYLDTYSNVQIKLIFLWPNKIKSIFLVIEILKQVFKTGYTGYDLRKRMC